MKDPVRTQPRKRERERNRPGLLGAEQSEWRDTCAGLDGMDLTGEEKEILRGGKGPALQKIMRTLVWYGQTLGAKRFVDIEGDGHFALSSLLPGTGPRLEMLDELAAAGLKTKFPFTLDPRPPLDFGNLNLSADQGRVFDQMFKGQDDFEERMRRLGLRDEDAFTCTPYFPEVGNRPRRGQVLAWSESSCVVFANSVLGARTNRNAVIMDLLSNILGKTPFAGLLTEAGRRAGWLIKLKVSDLPDPQLLGGAIGRRVVDGVPFIVGLDRFLGPGLPERTVDYLKEMGAACAAIGAVGLFHAANITPEAVDLGTKLLARGYNAHVIDESELKELIASYPVMWKRRNARPKRCLIGCPHLSLRELRRWTSRINRALEAHGRKKVAVKTILCAAPQVIARFQAVQNSRKQLRRMGLTLSPTCPEAYMDNPLCAGEAVATDSNKLRAFSSARLTAVEELPDLIASGRIKRGR
jgi:predicted aconitase